MTILKVLATLLTTYRTPVHPLGSLNTRNVFKVIDPDFCRDFAQIQASSQQQQLTYKAVFGGDTAPAYRRRSGVEFSVTITIFHNYEPVLEQQVYFLQRFPKSFEPRFQGTADEDASAKRGLPTATPSDSISVSQRDPRLWAAFCKDYNPIHISPMLAKAFGLKTVIAHGNHVAARLVEQLRSKAGGEPATTAQRSIWREDRPYTIETRFLKPMLLPAQLGVWWEDGQVSGSASGQRADFYVGKGGTVNMSGFVSEGVSSK